MKVKYMLLNKETVPKEQVEEALRTLIAWIGDDPSRAGLRETPQRMMRAFKEYFVGYTLSPEKILSKTFEEISGYQDPIVLRDIEFISHCEHHLAPIIGRAHIAYLPKEKVVGLSKLARLVDVFAKRLQIQERMTAEIGNALQQYLDPKGSLVIVEASHFCLRNRGICKKDHTLITYHATGCYDGDEAARQYLQRQMKS